jgi:cytochrome c
MLTAEESFALIQPVKSISGGGTEGAPSGVEHEGLILMKGSDCFACHKEKEKLLGPSFADIAAKYKADKDIDKLLVAKVKVGGAGAWGAIPMSPHPALKDEDITKMIQYIMTVKGGSVATGVPVVVETKNSSSESALPLHEGFALIQKNDCIACHKNDARIVGPSYQEIAEKYKDDKEAIKKLSEKVKKGGSGVWGEIPMGPHATVSDADITIMVEAVMTLKKGNVEEAKVEVVVNEFTAGFEAMKKSDCYACHKDQEALVGPSFLDIAKKYKENKDIKGLSGKIKNGGSGVWGQVPMLPHPQLSDEEIEKMVQAVLSVK